MQNKGGKKGIFNLLDFTYILNVQLKHRENSDKPEFQSQ